MVKFGKKFREGQIEEWRDEYLDYKKLKKKIKEILAKLRSENSLSIIQNQEPEVKVLTNIKDAYTRPNGVYCKEFILVLDEEFRRVYVHFISMEKELYVQINSHLYLMKNFSTLSMEEICKELDALEVTIYLAQSLKRFVNSNITAIKKILKKFDKKFAYNFDCISFAYLVSKLSKENSDFEYMLQFKVIDETNVLVEDILNELIKTMKTHPERNRINEMTERIPEKIKSINDYIILTDKYSDYQIKYKEWFFYVKEGKKSIKNNPDGMINDIYNPLMCSSINNNDLITKMLSDRVISLVRKEQQMSINNKVNVTLCYMHAFLVNMMITIIIPTVSQDLNKSGKIEDISYAVLWGVVPLFSFLSNLIFGLFDIANIKYSFVISTLILAAGNLIYLIDGERVNVNRFKAMLMSRCIVGLGLNPYVGKKYITHFVPREFIQDISLYYLLSQFTGMAGGAIIGCAFNYANIKYKKKFLWYFILNTDNFSIFFAFISSLIFGIVVLLPLFSKPFKETYDLTKERLNTDFSINISGNTPLLTSQQKMEALEIERKFSDLNEKNQFSDSNLIPKYIQKDFKLQKKCWSYLNKAFFIIQTMFIVCRIINEAFILVIARKITSLVEKKENEYSTEYAMLLLFTLVISAPMNFFLAKGVSRKTHTRKLLILFIGIATISLVGIMLVTHFLDRRNSHWYILFGFLLCVLTICTSLIEIIGSNLLINIMPPQWRIFKMYYGVVMNFGDVIGRGIGSLQGCIMLCLMEKTNNNNTESPIIYIMALWTLIFLVLEIVISYNYKELRVKAISRMLRSKYLNKLK